MGIAQHPNWGKLVRASKYIDGKLVQRYAASLDEARQIQSELDQQKDAADQQAQVQRKPTKRGGSTPLRGIYLIPRSKKGREAFGVRHPATTTSIIKFGAACAWWQSCGVMAQALGFDETPSAWLMHLPLMIEGRIRFIEVPEDEIHVYAPYWAHEGRIRAANLLDQEPPAPMAPGEGHRLRSSSSAEAFLFAGA